MSISLLLFSSPIHFSMLSPPYSKPHLITQKPFLSLKPKSHPASLLSITRVSADNGAGTSGSPAGAVEPLVAEKPLEPPQPVQEKQESPVESSNGSAIAVASSEVKISQFKDRRWVGGTWDLMQFGKGGKTDWDAVIDAEARRRKWLEENPESSSNENPIVFDTSIIPWWAWIKRYHLPEAELLNGRAAMIGFFMAYFVDSLTGVGLVDQMSNFLCKTLLFVAVVGVLLIRKNEDIDNIKKLIEETTFYDKQWQATWKDENSNSSKDQ